MSDPSAVEAVARALAKFDYELSEPDEDHMRLAEVALAAIHYDATLAELERLRRKEAAGEKVDRFLGKRMTEIAQQRDEWKQAAEDVQRTMSDQLDRLRREVEFPSWLVSSNTADWPEWARKDHSEHLSLRAENERLDDALEGLVGAGPYRKSDFSDVWFCRWCGLVHRADPQHLPDCPWPAAFAAAHPNVKDWDHPFDALDQPTERPQTIPGEEWSQAPQEESYGYVKHFELAQAPQQTEDE